MSGVGATVRLTCHFHQTSPSLTVMRSARCRPAGGLLPLTSSSRAVLDRLVGGLELGVLAEEEVGVRDRDLAGSGSTR
jgi:hypothetical protein